MLDNYEIISADNAAMVMKTKQGNTVTLHFSERADKNVENMITDNLIMSYEARMKSLN